MMIAPIDYSEGSSSTPYQPDSSKFKPLAPCRVNPCESSGFKWKGNGDKETAMPKDTFTWTKEEKRKFATKMKEKEEEYWAKREK